MPADSFRDFVLDQLRDLEALECRPMFGGFGLYLGDAFFGIIYRGALYFRTDHDTRSLYDQYGSTPLEVSEKQTLKNYCEVPADIIDDRQALSQWALTSAATARPTPKAPKAKKAPRRRR